MGCISSKQLRTVSDVYQQEGNNSSLQGKTSNESQENTQPSNVSTNKSAYRLSTNEGKEITKSDIDSSKSNMNGNSIENVKKITKKQRRRLSVAPEKVGAISTNVKDGIDEKVQDPTLTKTIEKDINNIDYGMEEKIQSNGNVQEDESGIVESSNTRNDDDDTNASISKEKNNGKAKNKTNEDTVSKLSSHVRMPSNNEKETSSVSTLTKNTKNMSSKNTQPIESLTIHDKRNQGQKFQRAAFYSKKGQVPYNRNKVNQDRFLVRHGICNDEGISLFGVMDGHGEFGHLVAEFVRQMQPIHLNTKDIRKDPYGSIYSTIEEICILQTHENINIAFSGTTVVFGVRVDEKQYVANIGDSRCVLARIDDNGIIQAIPQTRDQKPDYPDEKERIIKAGGRVEPLPGPPNEDRGPDRVWQENIDLPGQAMSRSIGDEISQKVGVISTPEITEHVIDGNDIFAVWASDGVWEFLSNEDVVYIILQNLHSIVDATHTLVNISNNLWRQNEEVVDDITCVIVQFHNYDSTTSTYSIDITQDGTIVPQKLIDIQQIRVVGGECAVRIPR